VASGGAFPYSWSIVTGSLPPGLTLNSAGGITGIPTATGVYVTTFAVTDSIGTTVSRSFSISIIGSAQFSIITTSLAPATLGQSYSQALTAANGTPPYQWSVSQGLPAGLTLSTSGIISGIPTAAGSFLFQVQATDAGQRIAIASLSITVNVGPLTITTVPPLFSGIVGIPYAQSFSASGGKPPYIWSLLSGGVPGLTLDPATGALQGTPVTAGTFPITVQAADSTGSRISQSFSVVVNQPSLTVIASGQLSPGTAGVTYSQKIPVIASGGTPPYTWSIASGSVPGLDFDPVNVALSGTPTTAGTFTLTVQVRDSAGQTSSRAFNLTIAPASLNIATARQLPDTSPPKTSWARQRMPSTIS